MNAPQWGVRIGRGIVTYFNDEPLVTWEQACEAREKIEAATGEFGEVEKVYVLAQPAPTTSDGDQAVAPSSASPVSRGAAPSSGEERET